MKTETHKTMPAREYYGDRPLWTPEAYYRIATAKTESKIPTSLHHFLIGMGSILGGFKKW